MPQVKATRRGPYFLYLFLLLLLYIDGYAQFSVKGLSLVAPSRPVEENAFKPIVALGANWVAHSPFAYMPAANTPELQATHQWQWWGEKLSGSRACIRMLHRQGLQVMLKPQLWVGRGTYTGEIRMSNASDWASLETAYRDYIMAFAKLAQEEKVALFCIGTELRDFVQTRPLFWHALIAQVKTVYHGKLTYAGNWDSYQQADFWASLDYIGVDAYFPVHPGANPTLEELKAGWIPIRQELQRFSKHFHKPILFTEYGYRNRDYTAHEPWRSDRIDSVNDQAQTLALQALHLSLQQESWFVGGFLWKWHLNPPQEANNRFTVQGKPAEQYLRKFFHQ